MSNFIISGFSDEIDSKVDVQFSKLNELGIGYFEPRGIDNKNISDLNLDEAKSLKQKMDNYSIKVSSIGSPIGKINITDSIEEHLEVLKRTIQTAHILDTKYIRVFSFYGTLDDIDKYRGEVLDRMYKMTEVAKKENIILLHENEKGIYGDIASRCLDILQEINSDNLRAVFDPANFVQCGQSTYPEAYSLLKPYITYMHIKDALQNGDVVPAGHGIGNVKAILDELDASNYDGFLSIEPHLGNFNGLANLENGDKMTNLEMSTPQKFELAYNSLKKLLK